jgi:hypothetical protein
MHNTQKAYGQPPSNWPAKLTPEHVMHAQSAARGQQMVLFLFCEINTKAKVGR